MATFELFEQPRQPVLTIRARTNLEALPALIDEIFTKIAGYLSEIGEAPTGAPFTAYHNLDIQDLDVEMGFPVSRLLPAPDGIMAAELPPGLVAATMCPGRYAEVRFAHGELLQWIVDHGYEPTGVCYEYYYNVLGEGLGNELLTMVVIPLQ